MAGIEVAGLVLGGFSLVISAMEHYGTMEKMSRTWWKFRREHRRDLGRLRDCELLYRANIRTLLVPLELDGTIDSVQLETLLADLGDNGWQSDDVEAVLTRRLGERKERYFDNLREMNETIVKLAKISMALDKRFQASLDTGTQTRDPVARASQSILLRANDHVKFELKKVGYTLSMYKREALLDIIERCNNTLKDFLSVQDGTQDESYLASRTPIRSLTGSYKTILAFWRHADRMHQLMQIAWRCSCLPYHCVSIQLCQRSGNRQICLDMTVRFCDRTTAPQAPAQLWERIPIHLARKRPSNPSHAQQIPLKTRLDSLPLTVKFDLPSDFIQQSVAAGANGIPTTNATGTVTTGPLVSAASKDSLCDLAGKSQALGSGACICTLDDDTSDDVYGLFRATATPHDDHVHSLADILAHGCAFDLLHMHRLALAYNIARSFLKLYETPWLNAKAMSTSIYLPVSPDGQSLLHKQAFFLSHFHHVQNLQPSEDTFILLGILLLELCFNKTLEQHPQWQAWQKLPDPVSDPILRLAIATVWARNVEDVWSVEGAQAINWCLHTASLQSGSWREEFACSVVEPLRILCSNAGLNID